MRERAKVGYPLEGQDLMLTIRQVRTVGPKEKTALRTLAFIRAGCMCNPRSRETGQQHEGGICGYR
ncbi:hypothetical protein CY34DRAFT_797618 [Suillus luteus UH-Slu-Lm8-n1]|uniref:Uncharacterized protein n=1 Tax=Suillus luteus UH-Slu-Lm8-n1 TaxID=930992 RepID=A0A0D0BGP9_9AGAM|nr:hypothetical protein CY34DRAFT_797618 [Suillus luteus UH-Slu-Lm8-n1]